MWIKAICFATLSFLFLSVFPALAQGSGEATPSLVTHSARCGGSSGNVGGPVGSGWGSQPGNGGMMGNGAMGPMGGNAGAMGGCPMMDGMDMNSSAGHQHQQQTPQQKAPSTPSQAAPGTQMGDTAQMQAQLQNLITQLGNNPAALQLLLQIVQTLAQPQNAPAPGQPAAAPTAPASPQAPVPANNGGGHQH
ncbi:MAG: hypothetical protein HYU64_13415 [Armatimonadetes bacterium]|nr:hypothetical protein [Armatimonadota bacterium]